MFLVLSSGQVCKIKKICNCEKCKSRGQTEVFIDDLYGHYLDCIKYQDLFDRKVVLNLGYTLDDLTRLHSNEEINRMVADLYQTLLIKSE